MPSFTPQRGYQLTSSQVDLILHCLDYCKNLTIEEDNERRKIVEQLNDSFTETDPYPSDACQDHYYTCDY